MQRSRAHPIIVQFLTLFVLLSLAGAAHADQHGDRVTFDRDFAFTDSEGNVTEEIAPDFDSDIIFQLGTSGSGSYPISCEPPGGGQETSIFWVSPPVFADPPEALRDPTAYIKAINDLNITMGISGGQGQLGTAGPVATGPVHFQMDVGWVNPGDTSIHWHNGWRATDMLNPSVGELDLDLLPLGTLSGPVQLEMSTADGSSGIRTEALLVFNLIVTCDDSADFTLGFGAPANMEYIWGEAGDADTTGGGVPDRWAMFPDGTQWSYDDQIHYGTDPFDAQDHPGVESECPGYTIQEAVDEGYERGDASTCPGAGGIHPLLLLSLLLLIVVLVAGGAYGAVTTVNKKIRIAVSHDGFQDIKQGASAQYELTLSAKGNEDEEVPVELSLKGVPEQWSASVDPAHMTLIAGEEPEPVTAALTITPPPEEEYEAEAVVTVTATPTDADGKTSPLKPGSSVKTKTIVNIDAEPPEGEKKARKKKAAASDSESDQEAMQATESETEEKKSGFKGALGRFKPKGKKKQEDTEDTEDAEGASSDDLSDDTPEDDDAASAPGEGLKADSGQAAAMKKPDLAVGKLSHEPADFSAGDSVTTTVPVKNKGGEPVQGLLLRLYVNDDRVDEKELDLEPGDASEVTFTWTAQPDENRVRVRGGLKEA